MALTTVLFVLGLVLLVVCLAGYVTGVVIAGFGLGLFRVRRQRITQVAVEDEPEKPEAKSSAGEAVSAFLGLVKTATTTLLDPKTTAREKRLAFGVLLIFISTVVLLITVVDFFAAVIIALASGGGSVPTPDPTPTPSIT